MLFLIIFLILLILLAFHYKRSARNQETIQQSFWERESAANATPGIDLDTLTYITIPLDRFPIGRISGAEIQNLEQQLKQLSTRRILNLTGKTNTELKEEYGVPNLETVQTYGESFDQLTLVLKKYGEALLAENCFSDAVKVLEFGVAVKTDVSQNYILLGKCYAALGQYEKISYLIEQVSATPLLLGPSICRQLEELLDKTPSDETPRENFTL